MTPTDHDHRPPGQKGAGMTNEQSRKMDDEQPEVEGHKQAARTEFVAARGGSEDTQEQEEPDVEGHLLAFGPERSLGPEKATGPEGAV
jgi:hypothetical protein